MRLEDRGDESIWKLEDPAVLQREQQAKQQAAADHKYTEATAAHSKKQAVGSVAVVVSQSSPLLGLLCMLQGTCCLWDD